MRVSGAVCLGERRLPASRNLRTGRLMAMVSGKLPETAGWQPALPSKKTQTAPPRRGDR